MARSDRRRRRAERKKSKEARKEAGIKGVELALLRPFKGLMIKSLDNRFPSVDHKKKFKNNFNGLILKFYETVVWPNRSRIADFSKDDFSSFYNIDYVSTLPDPGLASLILTSNSSGFVEDAVKVATSIVKAIINFFKSLKRDKEQGTPLGDLGDVAEEVVRVDDELGEQVRKEAAKEYIEKPAKKLLGLAPLALLFIK